MEMCGGTACSSNGIEAAPRQLRRSTAKGTAINGADTMPHSAHVAEMVGRTVAAYRLVNGRKGPENTLNAMGGWLSPEDQTPSQAFGLVYLLSRSITASAPAGLEIANAIGAAPPRSGLGFSRNRITSAPLPW